jgi:hypothetical protein
VWGDSAESESGTESNPDADELSPSSDDASDGWLNFLLFTPAFAILIVDVDMQYFGTEVDGLKFIRLPVT